MILYLFAIITGFAILIWSADKFINGATCVTKRLGMPSLLIGILIVGFGTSAPEVVISAIAAIQGNPALALGNAIGSNIVNIALILGATALIAPISMNQIIVKKEIPLLILISLLLGYLLLDNTLTFKEGIFLLFGLFLLISGSIFSAIKEKSNNKIESNSKKKLSVEQEMSLKAGIIWLVIGLILLIASSKLLVWGAVGIAHDFGFSDLIIGLTIVALGTSLPELAASIVAARKGEHDLVIGNIVGSNIFNILAVIGIAVVINPMNNISLEVLHRDWPVMMGLTIALLLMSYGFKKKKGKITRFEGAFLLVCYLTYNTYLGMNLINIPNF